MPKDTVFVHIPRTGGASIVAALHPNLKRHLCVVRSRMILINQDGTPVEEDGNVWAFTIIRDPVEIVASWYYSRVDWWNKYHHIPLRKLPVSKGFRSYCRKLRKMSFTEFVFRELPRMVCRGGFLKHYLGHDNFVYVYRYEDGLENIWANLQQRLGVKEPLPNFGMETASWRPQVGNQEAKQIREWCWRDPY